MTEPDVQHGTLRAMRARGTLTQWTIVLLMAISAVTSVRYRIVGEDGRAWQRAINNDGKGYYEHLRALLVESPDNGEHGEDWMFAPAGDGKVIKYFVGTAVLQAPYVLVAHLYSTLFSAGPEDGYSLQYHLVIILSAWMSLLLGLVFTRKLLLQIGADERATSLTLIAITLGTGLLVQTVLHPGMSHVHSFAAVAALLTVARSAYAHGRRKDWILTGALLGLVLILRPVDGLVILAFPMAFIGVTKPRPAGTARNIFLGGSAMALMLLVQGLTWHVQCGEWIVRPYAGEGFHWDRPAFASHLFSFRNGLLFYWPILLLVIPGTYVLFGRSPRQAGTLILFLLAFGYVTSAWWNWSYGDSFGQRPYVDIPALLAIPIAFTWYNGSLVIRTGIHVAATAFIALNLFQSWQYANGILVPARMNAQKYRYVLLRTDPARGEALGGIHDLAPYAPKGMAVVLDSVFPWRPDTIGEMSWLMPATAAGPGLWFLELGIVRTRLDLSAYHNNTLTLHGTSDWWPAKGIDFKLDQVPVAHAGTAHWKNSFRLPPQTKSDLIFLRSVGPDHIRLDSVVVRLSVPR